MFSDFSFGFRPGKCQHDAIYLTQKYVEDGYRQVVDCDLSKFFDRVHHDRLLSRLMTRVHDKRLLKVIRSFLTGDLVESAEEGTPQGGPLSPLLSNIVLDELDKELEKRGLTDRNCGRSIHQIIFLLNQSLRGWWNYYRIRQGISMFRSINGWIMRRLRAIYWKQWKNPRTHELSVNDSQAMSCRGHKTSALTSF